MKRLVFSLFLCSATLGAQNLFPKNENLPSEDSLKGSDTRFRNFWDVKKYDITVEPDFEKKSVSGSNTITFEITKDIENPVFQIDLQQPIDFEFINKDKKLTAKRDKDFIFITANKKFKKGEKQQFTFKYWGKPIVAKNAPWDGGWVFAKDKKGNPWMSVAQEGNGASLWLPIKDIWNDEPDLGIVMKIIVPENLVGVGNGRLISQKNENGKKAFIWEVKNPINDYSIVPTIGKLANFKDQYSGEKGKLDLDYWVLEENLDKAKSHFPKNVQPMLKALEHWFGPYPFYEDSYKLVETPYLGMEHQSNVAYGNKYMNGYLGHDLSGTGLGLEWDYIIIHESGHEWYANNITAKDQADMWIHESFTTYSEVLFEDHFKSKEAGNQYAIGLRKIIENNSPIIGEYGLRREGSGDMYPKGANMIHTIRQVVNDDEKFRQILRKMNKDFYHQTVTTQQIENFISQQAGFDFGPFFNQYLRGTKIPVLEYSQDGKTLKYRYSNVVENFNLPLRINDGKTTIKPKTTWETVTLETAQPVVFDQNYYIEVKKI